MEGDRSSTGSVPLRNILGARFCANRDYRLVLFDRLAADQQELLRDLVKDPEFYGLLVPPDGSYRKPKSVCQSTALLLYTLAEPGPLPGYVQTALGGRANQSIAEMVLDEVLMIESEGSFVCGSEAYELLYLDPHTGARHSSASSLTEEALQYAHLLDLQDGNMLSARLYAYNRVPLSPRWRRLLSDREATAQWLGIDRNGKLWPLLEGRWERMMNPPDAEGWFHWSSSSPQRAGNGGARTGYKLYVSPMPAELLKALRAVIESLADSAAYHFKVGDDAYGLLRPDKIVIYFDSFEDLSETARDIAARLPDCPAQGVPFTAALEGNGLLSWGVDPPPQSGVPSWQERESWRLWITNKIAAAMIRARESQNGKLEPWRFALERLRLDAIDTTTWAPLAGFGHSGDKAV